MYKPLDVKSGFSNTSNVSLMPKEGENLLDLPQLLDTNYAQVIINYIPERYGLDKRKGLDKIFERAGANPITLLKEYTTGEWIFGYAEKIEAYNEDTEAYTTIKDDFKANSGFGGARYGDYFLVINGVDKMQRIYKEMTGEAYYDDSTTNTLVYSGKTVDFVVGQVVTGSLSGATATVTADSGTFPVATGTLTVTAIAGDFQIAEALSGAGGGAASSVSSMNALTVGDKVTGATSGATGILLEITGAGTATQTYVIGLRSGEFDNGEAITDDQTVKGKGLTTSTLNFAIKETTDAPICNGIKIIGSRAYAFNLLTDNTQIQYSPVDDGSNPPFDNWTTGTDADEGGTVNYRNAGTVRSVVQLGAYTVGFSDDGFFAFILNTLDSAGTLKKVEVIQNYTEDFGGATGAIETPIGIFYVNEAGLNQMVEVGATNAPYSRQDVLTSKLLGSKYFESADQSQVDLVYDKKQNCIFTTLSQDSENNNLVIGYKLDQKAFFRIKGWNINRWAKSGQDIYGASSIKTTVYKCFQGYDDDGLSIGTEYQQELKIGNLWSKNKLKGGYIQGFLSHDTKVYVSYNIYTEQGKPIDDKLKFSWVADRREDVHAGFDAARFDRIAFDGGVDLGDMVECFGGNSGRISNMQRLVVNMSCSDKLHHIINWTSALIENKGAIKRRNMTQL